jgi:uncharacterized radical SAM superfamily protein
MHLERSPEEVVSSFKHLCDAAPGRVAPHVLLGVGREDRELDAVSMAGKEHVACIILLSLLGTKVDDWEGRLVRAVEVGTEKGRPVLIGCMRPRGRPEVEVAALEAGAAGIACPAANTVARIKEKGWKVGWRQVCCALHR